MGVDVELKVKKLSLWYWKSFFDRSILGLFFTDADLHTREGVKCDEADAEEAPRLEYRYSTTVRKAIQRLDSIGYTLSRVQSDFEHSKDYCLDYMSLFSY